MKKLKIDGLKVNSFVTALEKEKSETIVGGLAYTTNVATPIIRHRYNISFRPCNNPIVNTEALTWCGESNYYDDTNTIPLTQSPSSPAVCQWSGYFNECEQNANQ